MSQDLYNERVQNIVDAINFKEPKKVPVGMEFIMWPFAYAGKTYKEVMDDPALTAESYVKFLDDISLDYVALMAGVPQPVKAYQRLGNNDYVIARDDTGIGHVQAEAQFMHADEYPLLIEDLAKFRQDTMLKKKFPVFNQPKDVAYEALKEAAIEYKKFFRANALINEDIHEKRQIVSLLGPTSLRYTSAFNAILTATGGLPMGWPI